MKKGFVALLVTVIVQLVASIAAFADDAGAQVGLDS